MMFTYFRRLALVNTVIGDVIEDTGIKSLRYFRLLDGIGSYSCFGTHRWLHYLNFKYYQYLDITISSYKPIEYN